MRKERISETIGNISPKYIAEASNVNRESKSFGYRLLLRYGAAAACFALVAVFAFGIFQGGIFGSDNRHISLENGGSITFVRSGSKIGLNDLAYRIEVRELTEDEVADIFGGLPVSGHVILNADDGSVLGIEGRIGESKLIISAPGVNLVCAVVQGSERRSEVDGVSVNAGYFVNDANEIYYASFSLGESLVYIEHSGIKIESKATMSEISEAIQSLVRNGDIDLNKLS